VTTHRRMPVVPARSTMIAVGLIGVAMLMALIAGVAAAIALRIAVSALLAVVVAAGTDFLLSRRAWRQSQPVLRRRLPAAFAIGVQRSVDLAIEITGSRDWQCSIYDHADPTLTTDGLPIALTLRANACVTITYGVVPTTRGEVTFLAADVRVRSQWGFCELLERLGTSDRRRVYPDFAQVARYAWLAGDRRLQEIGVKTYQQRGQGTDFKQLSEYRVGDPVRHIDWRATHRHQKPIVREFQDERDQNVVLLMDCGRRMRADDRVRAIGATHFDQVLNAVMLLTYVALKQGDAVGAMTFATPPAEARVFAARKGQQTLNALMSELYAVQPTATHPDYVEAAQDALRRFPKRSLVILITNFRSEDGTELRQALRLLRTRHLVLVASLRERVVAELIGQPLDASDAPIDVASAHLYEQQRRDSFVALAARDALMIDVEPELLGVTLVNRYHAVKRAGLI
jgi:uncharacterized protein (DUF58 family)